MADAVLPEDCDWRIRRLYDYWRSVHPASGGLPGRQHIDPAAFPELLPWLWLVDVERQPLRFRYRLVGTEQVQAMDADLTGRYLDEAHPVFPTSVTYPQYVAAAERGEVGYYRGPPAFHITKKHVAIERVLLPLARDAHQVDILLALTVYRRASAASG